MATTTMMMITAVVVLICLFTVGFYLLSAVTAFALATQPSCLPTDREEGSADFAAKLPDIAEGSALLSRRGHSGHLLAFWETPAMLVCILTVSDRAARGGRQDRTGPALRERLAELGNTIVELRVVPDRQSLIEQTLIELCDACDLILTAGGTGIAPTDVTPEATRAVVDKEVPGLAEAMRARSLAATPHAMLSRAVAGVRAGCLIINLPGSPQAALECLEVVLPSLSHALDLLTGRQMQDEDHRA